MRAPYPPPPPPPPPLHPPPPPPSKCVNCDGAHPLSSKECNVSNMEKEMQKAKTEKKMSYHDARKYAWESSSWLIAGVKPFLASVAAKKMAASGLCDNPVRSKAPAVKGTQTATQTTVTPQQTPTEASQARQGRSSANKERARARACV